MKDYLAMRLSRLPATVHAAGSREHRLHVALNLATVGTDVSVYIAHLRALGVDTERLEAAYAELLRALYDAAERVP